MWDFDRYGRHITGFIPKINTYQQDRARLVDDTNYSDTYKASKLQEMDASMSREVESVFAAMADGIAADLRDAKKKAEPSNTGFDERTYYATIAAQDIAGKSPEDLLSLYEQVGKTDNRAHRMELERLIDGAMNGSEYVGHWWQAKDKYAAPEEKDSLRMAATAKDLSALLGSLKGQVVWTLQELAGSSAHLVSVDSLLTIWEQIRSDKRFTWSLD